MASPIPAADVDASVIESAGARLAAALSGAPAPVPAAPVEAAPQPTGVPPGAPVAEPQPAATPPGLLTIDPSSLSPAAAKALQIAGGDPVKALELMLDYNNRLGARGQQAAPPPAPGSPEVPASPAAAASPEPQPAPPAEPEPDPARLVDPQAVEQQLKARLDADPSTQPLVEQYATNQSRLAEIGIPGGGRFAPTGAFAEISGKIYDQELRLAWPEVANDPLATGEIKDQIRTLRAEQLTLRQEASTLRAEQANLERDYNGVADRHRAAVSSELGRTVAAQRYAKTVGQVWPDVLNRAIADAKLPEEVRADFEKRAHNEFMLRLMQGEHIPVRSLGAFMAGLANEQARQVDTIHRAVSKQFGSLAHQRQEAFASPAAPGMPVAPGVAPAQVPSQVPAGIDLDAVERSATARFTAFVRAAGGR